MSKVCIPFLPRFKEPMLNGTKTMTSRSRRYGKAEDTFEIFGATFQILSVGKMSLGDIQMFWKEEGLKNREEFAEVWRKIHPYRTFDLTEQFFVHRFKKAEKPSLKDRLDSEDKDAGTLREELGEFTESMKEK